LQPTDSGRLGDSLDPDVLLDKANDFGVAMHVVRFPIELDFVDCCPWDFKLSGKRTR
jgi:hypothetical protein